MTYKTDAFRNDQRSALGTERTGAKIDVRFEREADIRFVTKGYFCDPKQKSVNTVLSHADPKGIRVMDPALQTLLNPGDLIESTVFLLAGMPQGISKTQLLSGW